MIVKIFDMGGGSQCITTNDDKDVVLDILEQLEYSLNIPMDRIELFNDESCIKRLNQFYDNDNEIVLTMLVHDKPIRITDRNLIRSWNTSWDIDKMKDIFGDIEQWDTSFITDMSYAFFNNRLFNENISNWDTCSVLYMQGMFSHARTFNQPIGKWNVSNVINMSDMFNESIDFSYSLQTWDLKYIKTDWMFLNAHSYNERIHMDKATQSTGMFFKAGRHKQFKQD